MQIITDKTVDIFMDVAMVTFALTAAAILIGLTFNKVEEWIHAIIRKSRRAR